MKKTIYLAGILLILIVSGIHLCSTQNRTVQLITEQDSKPLLSLKTEQAEETLEPWFNKRDGRYYFFLPSFAADNKVYCDRLQEEIWIDGEVFSKGSVFVWEAEKTYTVSSRGQEYKMVFMKSSKIPALFLETESGTMEQINADKTVQETGSISLIQNTKNAVYQGNVKKISARGNSTFDNKDKKAYSITLENSVPLCGMDAAKKWNLLAMYYEYDKIHTRLVFDMAEKLDMEYSTDGTWVDLYCNGRYQGLYLLTESVGVGEGRVQIRDQEKEVSENISGGYLIEKDVDVHLEEEGNGFVTKKCQYPFIVKSPKAASEEQIGYIADYIQKIEDLLLEKDQEYKKYIDLDSFAKQFLIDKLVLEPDAMNMSAFYYKEADSDVLKAGPLWDYDRAFGEALSNYTLAMGDSPGGMQEWYMQLYDDREFKDKVIACYKELLPFLQEMLETGIDAYVNHILDSVKMDSVMWPNEEYQTDMMGYLEYESHVKYLKYFLEKRICYLNEIWEISDWQYEAEQTSDQIHQVTFVMDDDTLLEVRSVLDGSTAEMLPELPQETYLGWEINRGGKLYSSYLPIYEDVILRAQRKFETVEERMSYKTQRLKASADLETYLKRLQDEDFSVCIYIDGSRGAAWQEEILLGIKKICRYKHPDWLDQPLDEEKEYFILVDNGWREILDSDKDDLPDINTTFGTLSYGKDPEGERYLYIQEKETNYLSKERKGGLTFVVADRYTGEIVDTAVFE